MDMKFLFGVRQSVINNRLLSDDGTNLSYIEYEYLHTVFPAE